MFSDIDSRRERTESAGAETVEGTGVTVRSASKDDAERWDAFVRSHPRATFFHQFAWMALLESTFRYRPFHLVALRGDRVCGVLPLFRCRSLRGRVGLFSLPHTVYGGPVGDDAEVERALLDRARGIADAERAGRLELRNRYPSLLDLPVREGFLTFEKELPADAEQVYRTFPKKSREAINQARKRHKLEADFGGDPLAFCRLLEASYRNLGTPVFPRRFFLGMLNAFPDQTGVLLVRHEGAPVAGVLYAEFRGIMMPIYSGEAPNVARLRSSNFKYFRLMEHAVGRGLTRFDFGRTRASNEGVRKFKQNQGFEPEVLPYQTDPAGEPGGEGAQDPNKGVFVRLRRIWRRLPAPVARVLGPRIVKYFP